MTDTNMTISSYDTSNVAQRKYWSFIYNMGNIESAHMAVMGLSLTKQK